MSLAISFAVRKVYDSSGLTILPDWVTLMRENAPLRLARMEPWRSSPVFFAHTTENDDDLLLPDTRVTVSQSASERVKAVPPSTVNTASPPSTPNVSSVGVMLSVPTLSASGLGLLLSLQADNITALMAKSIRNIDDIFFILSKY